MSAKKRRRKKPPTPGSSEPPAPPKPRAPSRRPSRQKVVSIGGWIATAIVAAFAFSVSMLYFVYPARPGPGGGREVELVLVGDESPDALAGKLAGAGLVASPRLFAFFVRASGASQQVAPGPHLLTDDLSPRDLLDRIAKRGGGPRVKVAVPEGFTRFDIAKRLQERRVCTRRAFVEATEDPGLLAELRIEGKSAEGYLFPATYELAQDSLAADVVRKMKLEFERRWATIEERHQSGMLDLAESLHWGRREAVVLASMIEKEAVMDDERPIIASVFLNRLRDPSFVPRLLQCDPTAGYGCLLDPTLASCAGYHGKITHDVVADPENPYNTYKHEGLPPGPISNPGAKSLEAVLAPTNSHYLYFVAKGGGRHTFSETYGAHAAAIEQGRTHDHPTAPQPAH